MQIITAPNQLESFLSEHRSSGRPLGFVPTMGALHEGHISLIDYSLRDNNTTIASIFVNPTQFTDFIDFEKYPRQLAADFDKLRLAGCDAVFVPEVASIYPEPDTTQYQLGPVAERLEGAFRPGHFNGVASVVKRLFALLQPQKAYFGLKDYQQYLVIKTLVNKYRLPVEVVGCPTIRDEQGLAMSSRNQLLSPEERRTALALYRALRIVADAFDSGVTSGLQHMGWDFLNAQQGVQLEYFDIAEQETLLPIGDGQVKQEIKPVALAAARVGNIRLIDNMLLR